MKDRIKKVIFYNVLLIVIFLGYYFLNITLNFKIDCLIHKITGLYCPGCGITRCLFSILKLDFKSAFHYNMFVFILLPFILIYYIDYLYSYIFDKENKLLKNTPSFVYYILIVLAIIFGILRNLESFKFLSP